ncbi:MAG: O-antigen ligase family protein [Candidatus Helarchaeota archaeon]
MNTLLLLSGTIVILIFLFLVFSLEKYQIENLIKKYYIYVYVFTFPLLAILIPVIKIGPLSLNSSRFFLIPSVLLLIILYIKDFHNVKISKIGKYLIIYYSYLIINSATRGFFQKAEIIDFLFPITFIILMDNVGYNKSDFLEFKKVVSILAVIIFIVSFLQLVFNPLIYIKKSRLEEQAKLLVYGNIYRNESIFAGIKLYEGAIAIICLFIIFLFLNSKKYNLNYLLVGGLLTFSAFVTFTRSVWFLIIMISMYFLYYKYKKRMIIVLWVILFFTLIIYSIYFPAFQNSKLYQERLVQNTYMGRITSLKIYFKHFIGKKVIFGHGSWSEVTGEFRPYGRGTIHNGFLDILFRSGLIGLFLFILFIYQIYRRGSAILNKTGNPVFIVFLIIFILINMTGEFMNIDYYGYLLMLFYMSMLYQISISEELKDIKT